MGWSGLGPLVGAAGGAEGAVEAGRGGCGADLSVEVADADEALVVLVEELGQVVDVVLAEHLEGVQGQLEGPLVYQLGLLRVPLAEQLLGRAPAPIQLALQVREGLARLLGVALLLEARADQLHELLLGYLVALKPVLKELPHTLNLLRL